MKDYSNTSNFSNPGDYTFKEGCNKLFYTPRDKGPTEIRLVGPKGPDGRSIPQIDPSVDGKEGICDAFAPVLYAQCVGTKSLHFLVNQPPEGARLAVYPTFLDAIKKYVEEHPQTAPNEWRNWLGLKCEGQTQAPRPILKPARKYLFMQGYLYRNAGKPAKIRDGKVLPRENVVLGITTSASRDFLKAMQTPKDPSQPLSIDNSMTGDILSPEKGAVLVVEPYEHIFEDNRKPQTWYRVANCTPATQRAEPFRPQIVPLTQEQNDKCFTPWEEILNLNVPYETQISWLIETFSPAAVDYAFSSHPVYAPMVPKHCAGAFQAMINGSVTVSAQAASAPSMGIPDSEVPADLKPLPQATVAPAAPAAPATPATPAVNPATLTPPVPAPAATAAAPALPAMPAPAAAQNPQEMLARLNEAQAKLPPQ